MIRSSQSGGASGQRGVDEWSATLKFRATRRAVSAGVQLSQDNARYGSEGWIHLRAGPRQGRLKDKIVVHRRRENGARSPSFARLALRDRSRHGRGESTGKPLRPRSGTTPRKHAELDAQRASSVCLRVGKPQHYRTTHHRRPAACVFANKFPADEVRFGRRHRQKISRLILGSTTRRRSPRGDVRRLLRARRKRVRHRLGLRRRARSGCSGSGSAIATRQVIVIAMRTRRSARRAICRGNCSKASRRLGTDYADLYLMHRDNLTFPWASSWTCQRAQIRRADEGVRREQLVAGRVQRPTTTRQNRQGELRRRQIISSRGW